MLKNMFKKTVYRFIGVNVVIWLSSCAYSPPPNSAGHQPTDTTSTNPPIRVIPTRPPSSPIRPPANSRPVVNPAQILSAHNKVRARHRLPPLRWSPTLARFSTQWANHLLQTNSCRMQHRPLTGRFKTNYGENLYWASPLRWNSGRSEIQKVSSANVVYEWANEEKFYNYQTNRCQAGQQCGHYTQIVWHNAKQVGCGLAVCGDKSQVWVCSYDPPGNWQGERPY